MRHLKSGRKLGRTASHRKALLRNMAGSLIEHKRIQTTLAKAKELRPYVEHLITRAKNAILRERAGLLQEGQTVDVFARREASRSLLEKKHVQSLFDEVAPAVLERPGGYTRVVKLGQRRGDGGSIAIIELVDWNKEQSNKKARRKTVKAKTVAQPTKALKEETAIPSEQVAEIVEEPLEEMVETQPESVSLGENVEVETIVSTDIDGELAENSASGDVSPEDENQTTEKSESPSA